MMLVLRQFITPELCELTHKEFLRELFKPEDMPGRSYARSKVLEDHLGYETYVAGYTRGARLPIHTDSTEEDFHVISIAIHTSPGPYIWPLWVSGQAVYLSPGDAVLYGSKEFHWREAMPAGMDFMSVGIAKVPLTHI